MYDKRTFVLSSTLLALFFIQTRSTSVNFFRLGCFQDNRTRAMPEMLGDWRSDQSNAIQKCAQAAKSAGYLIFGVQYGGECWSGPLAHVTYKKYGTSTRCVNGIGGSWAQDVYGIVNASLTANYEVKRCYEVDVIFYYQIQGGLTSGTISSTKSTFSLLFSGVSGIMSSLSACRSVEVSRKDILNSPPGVESVYFKIPLIFTASTSVPDDEVSQKLTNCINTLSNYKQFLDANTPKIKEGSVTHSKYNLSTISNKTSCCGGDIPPPCCGVGSIQINSTKCGCLPGFKFVPGSLCVRCPSDTYQNKQGQRSCKKCPGRKQTFGKTGITSESNCSDTNPLQLSDQVVYLPYDIESETLVTNVTVTGRLESLVQPLLFYMEDVTQQQLSRRESKRKRRDIDDFCEGAGTIGPLSYFCVHRLTGGIEVTDEFKFENGDEFEIKIRVTDSDQWGKTENTASIKFISRDNCKEIRALYDDATRECPKNVSSPKGRDSCPSEKCLLPLFDLLNRLNSSEILQMECSSDPHDLANVARIYSQCIGPPIISLSPNPQTVKRGAEVILKCNASSPLPLSVTWFKNGMPVGQSSSHLKIDSFDNDDQGDYFCRFSTYLTSSSTAPALVTMEDTFTSRVSFRIVNKNFKNDLQDPRSSSYSDMQIAIERNLDNYLDSGNPAWKYKVKLVKFRDSFKKVGVDLVIYSPAKNEDIAPYYNRLQSLLTDESAMGNILKPLKVSRNSVTIRSATHCLPKETGKKSVRGIFEWQLTVIGGTSSRVKCPYGPPEANATRSCGGNFLTGGVWKSPDVSLCKYKSARTNKLNDIAKTKVDKQNVAKVTKEVKVLTSEPDDMNEADAVLIADVIDSIVLLDDSLNETAQDVVEVIDNVMKMKKKDLQESQRTSKASAK
ncbi:uncharacterized protein LOC111335350 isoform X3 [Stylophora pistillata]|nr:uncharacterized protein LOC111335350 isoform X3 [Stylophora pistillata]